MSDERGGNVKSAAIRQRDAAAAPNSPRSPIKLEDYANIRRPVKQQQLPEKDANQNEDLANGKSPFQQELEGALKERKKRGLVTGFSDSENSVDGTVEAENNNVVDPGYLQKVDKNANDQWQGNDRHHDSILFSNSDDVSPQHSEGDFDARCADDGNRSRRRHDSLGEFEQYEEDLMNHCSQSSVGLRDVPEESMEEDASGYGSRRSVVRKSDLADESGLSGDILHLDDTEGSGLMNENELREQGVLLDDELSEEDEEEEGSHSNGRLPPEDPDLVMKMYMEPSPRPPNYPEGDYSELKDFEESDEDYISALQNASVDDIARLVADGNISDEDEEEETSGSKYSQERFQEGYEEDNDASGLGSEHQEYDDMQSRTSKQSYLDHLDDQCEEDYERSEGSPEFGNTVIETGNLDAAILAAASKVENFVDEPEMESDGTSVSLGQFVPNSVRRNRPAPPGQRRPSLKGLRRTSPDLPIGSPNSASKKPSPRTTPRRSKPSSPRSVSHRSSPRDSVRSNSQYSERARRGGSSVRSNSHYSDNSHVESISDDDYLNGVGLRETSPTLISVYQNEPNGMFNNHGRPDGVPALDFGLSINSNVSFLPRDDYRDDEREEFAEQLQLDYDTLLAKYAQAENTIDQLRLGAKVNLFGDDPVPSQAVGNSYSVAKQPQVTQIGQPQQASMQHIINIVNTTHRSVGGEPTIAATPHTPYMPPSQITEEGGTQRTMLGAGGDEIDELRFPDEASSGGKAMALMFQAKELQEEVDAFETLLKENHLTPPEQKTAYDHLKVSQEKLESDYLQAKEEDNAMRRRNSVFNNGNNDWFDPERAVEGQIFQIGMKLDDLNGIVMENLRNHPVELTRPPSMQEMFPPDINDGSPAVMDHRTGNEQLERSGHQTPSHIPVVNRRHSPPPEEHPPVIEDAGDEDHYRDDVKAEEEDDDEEEEEDSPSPPFSPPSSPEPAMMYNGHSKDHRKHQKPASVTSSSPEFARKPQPSGKIHPRRQSSLANNNRSSTSPRTGSSDHLDNGGAIHKSPEMDMEDSGFMGSESSRQSNQKRPIGYKRPGMDNTRTKTRDNRRANSQIPQGQRSLKGQKPSHAGGTAPRWESPVHSEEGVVSESEEEEPITHTPVVRKHSKHGSTPRKSGLPKPSSVQHEPRVKKATTKLKHTPPHQSTPPSSKRHQRQSQPVMSPQALEKRDQTWIDPPTPRQSLRETHQYQYPHDESNRGNGIDGLDDEYFVPSSRLGSASKPAGSRPTSNRQTSTRPASNRQGSTTKPSRVKTLPHRTVPSTTCDDTGSEMTRSSVKSEALRALQDQMDEMKKQLADRNKPQEGYHEQLLNDSVSGRTPERERLRYGRPYRRDSDAGSRYGRPNVRRGSDAGSKSEAYQALREELEEVKEQLRQKQTIPPPHRDDRPSSDVRAPSRHPSAPLRDSLRESLRSQYIPQTPPLRDSQTRTSVPQSPLRQTYRSQIGQESPYRTTLPPKLHPSDLDHTPPPAVPHTAYRGAGGSPYISTRNEACPMCGGSGSHTHGEYQHARHTPYPAPPPFQPQFQPQQTIYSPMQAPPSGYTLTQGPPVVTSTPIANPMAHQSLNQSYAPAPTLPQTVPGHQYVAHNGTQPAYVTSVPSQPTAVHTRDETTPVVMVTPSSSSSRRKVRYYTREESSNSSNDDDVELYYRRTPRSSSRSASLTPRSSRVSRNVGILKKSLHSEVSYEDDGLDRSLEAAVNMAHRLKHASKRMLSSVRNDASRSESWREASFY